MPLQPEGSAVEPLMRAVHGARWVFFDEPHRLLFVGRVTLGEGATVRSYDIVTGEPHDQPWPLDEEVALRLGTDAAFAATVTERVNRGY